MENVTVSANISTTIKLRDYESLKIDIGINGIPAGASEEYLQEKLKEATATIQEVVDSLATELSRRLKEDFGR